MDLLESTKIICNSSNPRSNMLLSDDLLVEILCQLPEKPLIRFRCVCKAWQGLITEFCLPRVLPASLPLAGLYFRTYALPHDVPLIRRSVPRDSRDPFFRHLARAHDQELIDHTSFKDKFCGFVPFQNHSANNFLDCCNGLLLFLSPPRDCQYYVCNPMTREYVPIPKARCHRHRLYAALAFNPSESPCYKVVRFVPLQSGKNLVLDIFSSDTRQWVRHPVQLDSRISGKSWMRHSVYFDGALYRLSLTWHLVRFDLNEVSARAIRLPVKGSDGYFFMGCIGVSMDRLCYAKFDYCMLLIWSLEGGCEAMEWIFKHQIYVKMSARESLYDHNYLWFQPCAFHPTSDVIFLGTPRTILSYDVESKKLEEVYRTRDGVMMTGCFYPAFVHLRLLISLNHLGRIHCRSTQLKTISDGMRVLSLETTSDDLEGVQVQISNGSA